MSFFINKDAIKSDLIIQSESCKRSDLSAA